MKIRVRRTVFCSFQKDSTSLIDYKNVFICQFNSSWTVRVRRDDLLTMQVDGTHGSAIVSLRKCWVQAAGTTPRPGACSGAAAPWQGCGRGARPVKAIPRPPEQT